jgi:histidinol phosphatase-like PHP family hydrolase
MYDLHTHTVLSDGILLPSELIRTAKVMGYEGVAITDHVDFSNLEHVVRSLKKIEEENWEIEVLIGVEITHVPPRKIEKIIRKAKELGVEYIVIHGETIVEPVEKGTNRAGIEAGANLIAHPGLITEEDVEKAKENCVFLEITSRRGHSLTNGHVAKLSLEIGANLIVNSDLHEPEDLMSNDLLRNVAKGAGVGESDLKKVLEENPRKLLELFQI